MSRKLLYTGHILTCAVLALIFSIDLISESHITMRLLGYFWWSLLSLASLLSYFLSRKFRNTLLSLTSFLLGSTSFYELAIYLDSLYGEFWSVGEFYVPRIEVIMLYVWMNIIFFLVFIASVTRIDRE